MNAVRRIVSAASADRHHDLAAAFLREHAGEAVLIAPTRGAADEVARRCAGDGLAGVHRVTLRRLAAMLAAGKLGEAGLVPLSRLAMEALAARVTHELRRKKELRYFTPVSDTPGFAGALTSTVTELRLQGTDAGKLAETGAAGADLARLLAGYARHLERSGLADYPAILELAAEAAREGSHRLLGLPLLVMDAAVVTTLESRFLGEVAARAPAVLATVPEGDGETLATLEGVLGVKHERGEESGGSTLERVKRFLFFPEVPPADEPDSSVEIFSAAGEGLECVEMARRLHELGASGSRFDEAAVLLRSPERYLPLLEEALRRAGIPAYFSRGVARPDPAGRAFLALLACAAEGCSASRFGEYLSLAQVPALTAEGAPEHKPRRWTRTGDEILEAFQREEEEQREEAGGESAPVSVPIGWEQLLVDASVIGGQARWKRRLDGLAREMELQLGSAATAQERERLERRLGQLRALRAFALPLIDRLSALPEEAVWGEWIERLTTLAETALRHPETVLSLLNELRGMGEVGPASLEEVYGVLSERLSFLRAEPPARRYGCVWVGSIEEARGRCFDTVFLPGLAEGLFPRRSAEDPLLLDVYREPLGGLTVQDGRVARERLLLRIAAASARQRLIVSYPRMDTGMARPRVPSFYALEVLRAAEGRLPDLRAFEKRAASAAATRLGFPAPLQAKQAIDDAEYDLATLWDLQRMAREDVPGRGRYMVKANEHLGRSLRARYRRWRPAWCSADGLVEQAPAVMKILEGRRPAQRAYSATALQRFAACPYQFFLSAIMRLERREQKAALEKLDPLTRGALFHELQFEFFNALRSEGLLPLRPGGLARALDVADGILNETAGRYAEELAPAIPGVWRAEIEDIRTDLRGWVRHLAEASGEWTPVHFEYSFGIRRQGKRDRESREEEAVILDGARLRGSVDLIEKHVSREALRVTDHKTGKPPEPFPLHIGGGRFLQPLLYSLAVEKLLGVPVEMARLSYCTQRGAYTDVLMAVKDNGRHAIQLAMQTVDYHIGDGFLPAAPAVDACSMCEFHAACGPYEETRVGKKSAKELEPLQLVRSLP